MTSSLPPSPRPVQRRQSLRLPKRRHHILAGLGLLALVIIGPMLAVSWIGSSDDAVSAGSVVLPPTPEPPVIAQIDREDAELPDLLAGSVAIGENPTEALTPDVDALGNPVNDRPSRRAEPTPASQQRRTSPLDPSLTRTSNHGPIPGRAQDGRTAFQSYAKPQSSVDGRTVALIVGGLGINRALTQRAINELPANVTLSFAAHSPNLQNWINQARTAGHEVLLEIPMEGQTFDPNEPGASRSLRPDAGSDTNIDNLHNLLSRAQGYAGVINYRGEQFLNRTDAAATFLSELDASGLALIVDGAFEVPSVAPLAASLNLPYQQGFGLIDPSPDPIIIGRRLDALSNAAAQQSTPIGVGFAYPETIDAVKGWAALLSSDGLTLVPASYALK